MIEIRCPFTQGCGGRFAESDLNKHDRDFLHDAVKKKMEFMFIHCPLCRRRFAFNAVTLAAVGAEDAGRGRDGGKNERQEKDPLDILKEAGVDMPPPYLRYLMGGTFRPEAAVFRRESEFSLYTLREMCEDVRIDGRTYLRVNELSGYAESMADVWEGTQDDEFSLQELSECLSIGQENERVLFIDCRDSDSLWVFHPDGGDVRRTGLTLGWLIGR